MKLAAIYLLLLGAVPGFCQETPPTLRVPLLFSNTQYCDAKSDLKRYVYRDDVQDDHKPVGSHRISDYILLHSVQLYVSNDIVFTREMPSEESQVDAHGVVFYKNGKGFDTITIPAGTPCVAESLSYSFFRRDKIITLGVRFGKTKTRNDDLNILYFVATSQAPESEADSRSPFAFVKTPVVLLKGSNDEYQVTTTGALLLIDAGLEAAPSATSDTVEGVTVP